MLGVLLVLLAPVAAAQTLKVRITADPTQLTIEPGNRSTSRLSVRVEFQAMTCSAEAKAGVDLIVDGGNVEWGGADLHPDADTYSYPAETKQANFNVVVDAEAPKGSETTFTIQPVVHVPAQGECPGSSPNVDAPRFDGIRVRVPDSPDGPGNGAEGTNGDSSPSLGAVGLFGAVVLAFIYRRRDGQ